MCNIATDTSFCTKGHISFTSLLLRQTLTSNWISFTYYKSHLNYLVCIISMLSIVALTKWKCQISILGEEGLPLYQIIAKLEVISAWHKLSRSWNSNINTKYRLQTLFWCVNWRNTSDTKTSFKWQNETRLDLSLFLTFSLKLVSPIFSTVKLAQLCWVQPGSGS